MFDMVRFQFANCEKSTGESWHMFRGFSRYFQDSDVPGDFGQFTQTVHFSLVRPPQKRAQV